MTTPARLTPEEIEAIAQREPCQWFPFLNAPHQSAEGILMSVEERDALVAMARQSEQD